MDIESYLRQGYYQGTIDEIFPDLTLLENKFSEIQRSFVNKENTTWEYNNAIPDHPEMPVFIELGEIHKRHKMVKLNNLNVFQQLYVSPIPPDMVTVFRDHITDFLKTIYPIEKDYIYHHNSRLNALTCGDFIKSHRDGDNKDRLCGIIIYMSEQESYDENQGGGELVINTNIIIPPVKGTFVLLDYTKHNLEHEVRIVKNNFIRFAYVSFISKVPK